MKTNTKVYINIDNKDKDEDILAYFSDVEGPMQLGAEVEIYSKEKEIIGSAFIVEVDTINKVIALRVN